MSKDIREAVKKHRIDVIKPNYAGLAKQYGCDYRTVKAAYHEALEGGKDRYRGGSGQANWTLIKQRLKRN